MDGDEESRGESKDSFQAQQRLIAEAEVNPGYASESRRQRRRESRRRDSLSSLVSISMDSTES